MELPKLYKVLVNGRACHGGYCKYSLPTKLGNPGRWTTPITGIKGCKRGYHVTTDPMNWPAVGMQVYGVETQGQIEPADPKALDKYVCESIRLLPSDYVIPDWWREVEAFIESLANGRWLQNHEEVKPGWMVFDTQFEAFNATWRAANKSATWEASKLATLMAARLGGRSWAWHVAWHETWAAAEKNEIWNISLANDAALAASVIACSGLPIESAHVEYAKDRWEVWRRGYGLLWEVDGVLCVYRSKVRPL